MREDVKFECGQVELYLVDGPGQTELVQLREPTIQLVQLLNDGQMSE